MRRSPIKPGKPLQRRAPLRAAAPAKAEVKIPNARKCKVCGDSFRPSRGLQTWCTPECGVVLAGRLVAKKEAKAAAEDRKQTRAQLEAMKPRSYWVKRAQAAVNTWVRLRDADKPCISCGTTRAEAWHAGHFYSTAARPDLRFDPANIHRQCAQCNLFLSGNLIAYRLNLPARIGQAELDRLDGPPTAERATVAVLREIENTYRRKANQLEKLIR